MKKLVSITALLAIFGASPDAPAADADAVAAIGCEQWNSREFFASATADDVAACLAAGADATAGDENGNTPLHWAAQDRDADVVDTLLEAGAEVDARNSGGLTALHLAAQKNEDLEVMRALLDAGASVNAKSEAGQTPLHSAVLHAFEFRLRDEGSATVDDRNQNDPQPVEKGAEDRNVMLRDIFPRVEMLLEYGADFRDDEYAGIPREPPGN